MHIKGTVISITSRGNVWKESKCNSSNEQMIASVFAMSSTKAKFIAFSDLMTLISKLEAVQSSYSWRRVLNNHPKIRSFIQKGTPITSFSESFYLIAGPLFSECKLYVYRATLRMEAETGVGNLTLRSSCKRV